MESQLTSAIYHKNWPSPQELYEIWHSLGTISTFSLSQWHLYENYLQCENHDNSLDIYIRIVLLASYSGFPFEEVESMIITHA